MKAFLLKLAAIIVQHKLLAGIVAAAVVAGGVTTGVVVHNNNVNNNDVVVAENETKEIKEKETTKKTVSLETLKVALKDEATVFYTDSAITNDLFTVIGVYSDKSEKELTEFTITPVELVVGENTINFVVKDNGKDVSVDFTINVVDKPTEAQPNEEYNEYSNVDNTDYNTENNGTYYDGPRAKTHEEALDWCRNHSDDYIYACGGYINIIFDHVGVSAYTLDFIGELDATHYNADEKAIEIAVNVLGYNYIGSGTEYGMSCNYFSNGSETIFLWCGEHELSYFYHSGFQYDFLIKE